MKKIKYLVFLAVILSPVVAFGRTYSYPSFYDDGGGVSSSTSKTQISSYRRQSSDLQNKIKELGPDPIRLLSMPILFGVSVRDISPNFGDPRSGGRTHLGEDIIATKGTPIVSPTQAVVLRTEVGPSEGNAVYTANPGGETYVYMHLDRFGEGVKSGTVLSPGALIGYVGDTGNAAGGPAHLHFEVHNASSTPIDPFPLLVSDLPLKDKISDISVILKNADDPKGLAQFLADNFVNEFTIAKAQGFVLPQEMVTALASVQPITKVVTTTSVSTNNSSTVELQKYLIGKSTGLAALALAQAGTTGNFGPLTTAALAEFQASVGISPAVGYYGPITQGYISSHPLGTTAVSTLPTTITTTSTTVVDPISTPVSSTLDVIRDLQLGSVGEDVRELQAKLNSNGYAVAKTGPGSAGQETTYFGTATQQAVINFQIGHSITPAVGYVGPITRSALASI